MRLLLSAALAVLYTACSAATGTVDRSAALFTDEPAPRATCRILYQPSSLPAVSQLADSAELVAAVTEYAEQHPLSDGELRALYSVGFDDTGRVTRLQPIDYWLPEGEDNAFTLLVRQHLRPQMRESGSVRLLVKPGSDPAVRVGRSERCPPETRTSFKLTAPAVVQLQRPQPMRVSLQVSDKGDVVGREVLSSSGDAELDRWVMQELEHYQFAPGMIDGIAAAMDHEETVQIQARP
jgi:TonB family protein